MIRKENERWISELTSTEKRQLVKQHLKDLSPEERAAVQQIIQEVNETGDSETAKALYQLEYAENPVSPRQWIEDEEYMGEIGKDMYPKVKEAFLRIFEEPCFEVILTGCIDQDAMVLCADGSMPLLKDLIGQSTDVLSISDTGVSSESTSDGVDSGVQEVLQLTLCNGMQVRLTPDHRVRTDRGWVRADSLIPELDRVQVPRKIDVTPSCHDLSDAEAKLLGYLVGDGCSDQYRMRYCDGAKETVQEVIALIRDIGFDVTDQSPYRKNGAWEAHSKRFVRSGFRAWMQSRGIHGMRTSSSDAYIPDCICRAPKRQVALFLNRLWGCEGCITFKANTSPSLRLGMKSKRALDQVQFLLLRWGIQSRIRRTVDKSRNTGGWLLTVSAKENLEKFVDAIGFPKSKEAEARKMLDRVAGTVGNTNVDVVPMTWGDANDLLVSTGAMKDADDHWRNLCAARDRYVSRTRLNAMRQDFCDYPSVMSVVQDFPDDVAYAKIKKVEQVSVVIPVADIGVPRTKCFLANGIAVHNSTRWGKNYLATTCLCRIIYELLCLRNPQKSTGLAAGEPIHIAPLSVTQAHAQRIVFGTIANKLLQSPWFQRIGYEETKEEIRFPKNITLIGGASSDANVLGMNLFSAILDEINFHKGKTPRGVNPERVYDKSETIYRSIVRRIRGSFLSGGYMPGKLFLLSSKATETSFTERRIREAQDDPSVLVFDHCIWSVHEDKFSDETFTVAIGDDVNRPRILSDDEDAGEAERTITVPIDFRDQFENDIYHALRELAGVPTVAVIPFFQNQEKIVECVDENMHPPAAQFTWDSVGSFPFAWSRGLKKNAYGEMEPKCCPHAQRFAHIDPSTNRDATGFCVAHIGGWQEITRKDPETGEEVEEEAPIYHVDIMLRVVPPDGGGEIQYANVRKLIYDMTEKGYPICHVSMDSYQSVGSLQQLERAGYRTETISVDSKGHGAYTVLKDAIYEGRVRMPRFEPLLVELRRLEYDAQKQRVDHPVSGSKDCADALCGAIYSLSQSDFAGGAVLPVKGKSVAPPRSESRWVDGDYQWPDEQSDQHGDDDDFLTIMLA